MTAPALAPPVLAIDGLSVAYATRRGLLHALDDVSLAIPRGRAHGLVGESGSGKSTVVLALLGLLGEEAKVSARGLGLAGEDLLAGGNAAQRARRGDRMAAVFQDPGAALNPALTIGLQVAEPLMAHRGLAREAALARAVELLAEVGIPRPAEMARAYPHQLSGGMKQRALIAGALSCEPDLLLLDEPTTALDVTVEAQILDLLDALRVRRGLSILLVSHNLGIVDRFCDDLTVLYAGRVVEHGPAPAILARPRHPYTKGLLGALPRADRLRVARLTPIPGTLPDLTRPDPGCIFRPRCPFAAAGCEAPQRLLATEDATETRCHRSDALADAAFPAEPAPPTAPRADGGVLLEAAGLRKTFGAGGFWSGLFGSKTAAPAVDGVSFALRRGETLGLVGESGCGKTTLGRLVLRLVGADAGTLRFAGAEVGDPPSAEFRRHAQIVFQNPDSSLNPRKTVAQILRRPVELFDGGATEKRIDELLDLVRLSPAFRNRYPHQLSGGEKQRVGIARALASRPDFVVCDEAVSALDVSVQAAILNLLADLKDRLGVAYLFISHDISVIAHLADRVAVMYRGAIVEEGPAEDVLRPPHHPYTEALLSAVPMVGAGRGGAERIRLRGDAAAATTGIGCRFAARCPRRLGEICDTVTPPTIEPRPGHFISCHIPVAELVADRLPGRPVAAGPPAEVNEGRG